LDNIIKSFRIGMTATEVVVEIVRINPEISSLSFYEYAPHYNMEESQKKPILPTLLFHDPTQETIKLKREEITAENLKRITDSLEQDRVIGVLSMVRMQNEIYHLPLMDFWWMDSTGNLEKVKWFLKEIRQGGVILSSGRSYHYYGAGLMSEREWSNFLGDCLLSGLVDVRYIGHRFKDGFGILRLSACPLRPQIPLVVSILE